MAGARVLVAEDNLMVALDLVAILEDAGAIVIGPVARVSEALDLAENDNPEAAILDVNLLDGTATPLAERLIARGVPLVFCTGTEAPAEILRRVPDLPVFKKPTDAVRLIRELARLLGR
ncbi:MAG: response regulator [Pararhizobium sp.]